MIISMNLPWVNFLNISGVGQFSIFSNEWKERAGPPIIWPRTQRIPLHRTRARNVAALVACAREDVRILQLRWLSVFQCGEIPVNTYNTKCRCQDQQAKAQKWAMANIKWELYIVASGHRWHSMSVSTTPPILNLWSETNSTRNTYVEPMIISESKTILNKNKWVLII